MSYVDDLVRAQWSRREHAERLIAAGRLVLAVFSLFAIMVDPAEPKRLAAVTYTLLFGYLLYAVTLAAVVFSRRVAPRGGVARHVIDLATFSSILFLTDGSASPFFAWFVFALFSSALRFGSRGTVWTTAVALAVYLLLGVYSFAGSGDTFEANRFIIRSAYLAVVAALLLYLARYQERLQSDLARLAAWPLWQAGGIRELAELSARHTAKLFSAPRVVLLWQDHEEPWLYVSRWQEGRFELVEQAPDPSLETSPGIETSYLLISGKKQQLRLVSVRQPDKASDDSKPLPAIVSGMNPRSVIAVPLTGPAVSGWLYVLDKRSPTLDDLTLAEVVARLIVARLEQFSFSREEQRSAIAEDRMRVARSIHDGLLQAMAGAVHYLEVAHRTMATDLGGARLKITETQGLLMDHQRELRLYLQGLGPPVFRAEKSLNNQLIELCERFRRQWQIDVGFRGIMLDQAPEWLRREIFELVSEALFNAANHARAASVSIEAAAGDDQIDLVISDDGQGFPFHGTFQLAELNRLRRGPLSIKQRLESIGGDMTLESSPAGSSLRIALPLRMAVSG